MALSDRTKGCPHHVRFEDSPIAIAQADLPGVTRRFELFHSPFIGESPLGRNNLIGLTISEMEIPILSPATGVVTHLIAYKGEPRIVR